MKTLQQLAELAEKTIDANHMWHDSPIQPDELILARGILAIAKQQEALVEALGQAHQRLQAVDPEYREKYKELASAKEAAISPYTDTEDSDE